jgi:RNA polymerase sigma-70 factor (ECF subfamily)
MAFPASSGVRTTEAMAMTGEQTVRWFADERVNDTPAIASLVREHSALLYRVAYSVLRNPAEAEDAVQEIFLRVLQKPALLTGILELRPWLVRVTWNQALDRRRRARTARTDAMDAEFAATLVSHELPADLALADRTRMARVLAAIDRLPRPERQAILLSAVEELDTREIALTMSRSESSIRALLFRARTRLRQRLAKEDQP